MDIALDRRRAWRRRGTDAEAALWVGLRARRLAGFKFRRQHPWGPYILDFYCPERRLVVELDGGQHFTSAERHYDRRRTTFLLRHGVRVLRFPTDLVFREPNAVLEAILVALDGCDASRRQARFDACQDCGAVCGSERTRQRGGDRAKGELSRRSGGPGWTDPCLIEAFHDAAHPR